MDDFGLISVPQEQEIKLALFSMNGMKAPGPNGYFAIFFQHQWSTIKKNLISIYRDIFLGKKSISHMNRTLISLIPKVPNPENITQFRPIGLCNVVYMILTKILVHRIQHYLPDLISEERSSFVLGRQILDNIVIVQEIVHLMQNQKAKKGFMAIKVDLEKAYDRLRWDFIKETLLLTGLLTFIVDLIMQCVSNASM